MSTRPKTDDRWDDDSWKNTRLIEPGLQEEDDDMQAPDAANHAPITNMARAPPSGGVLRKLVPSESPRPPLMKGERIAMQGPGPAWAGDVVEDKKSKGKKSGSCHFVEVLYPGPPFMGDNNSAKINKGVLKSSNLLTQDGGMKSSDITLVVNAEGEVSRILFQPYAKVQEALGIEILKMMRIADKGQSNKWASEKDSVTIYTAKDGRTTFRVHKYPEKAYAKTKATRPAGEVEADDESPAKKQHIAPPASAPPASTGLQSKSGKAVQASVRMSSGGGGGGSGGGGISDWLAERIKDPEDGYIIKSIMEYKKDNPDMPFKNPWTMFSEISEKKMTPDEIFTWIDKYGEDDDDEEDVKNNEILKDKARASLRSILCVFATVFKNVELPEPVALPPPPPPVVKKTKPKLDL